MKYVVLRQLFLILASCGLASVAFVNTTPAVAATKLQTQTGETVFVQNDMDNALQSNVFLSDVFTLNNNKSYVGVFKSNLRSKMFYGTSEDLINWKITSNYFDLVSGNGMHVGISGRDKTKLQATADGVDWKTISLPDGIKPLQVEFKNGYFILEGSNKHDYLSTDAENWFDITADFPDGITGGQLLIVNGKLCLATWKDHNLALYSTTLPDETETKWNLSVSPQKEGYIVVMYNYNEQNVGVQLLGLHNAAPIFYVTSDLMNWEEKNEEEYIKSTRKSDPPSKDSADFTVDPKRFEAIETVPYKSVDEKNFPCDVSSVVVSNDGVNYSKEAIHIFLNGEKINKAAVGKPYFSHQGNFDWATEGAMYAIGRGYLPEYTSFWDDISRGEFLSLLMQSINVQEPAAVRPGYVRFKDVSITGAKGDEGKRIERANKLGLVSGMDDNQFVPKSPITRQDMMVMTYNILSKLGKIQPDETLSSLELFNDSSDVADYAKLAVSSLIKNGVISGDGAFIYPNKKMNNAEAMVLAKSLNVYRYR